MTAVENLLVNYNFSFDRDSTFHSITRIILQNMHHVSRMSINELAEFCFTSPSTISMIVKNLVYKNYSTFQSSLTRCLGEYRFHNVIVSSPSYFGLEDQINHLFSSELDLISQVKQGLDIDLVRDLATCLKGSNHVAIFPYVAILMELSLQSDLMYSGICCDVILDQTGQLSYAKKLPNNTSSIIIAPDGPAGVSHFAALLDAAARNGNKTCVITSSTSARELRKADYLFSFEGKQSICDQFATQAIVGAITLAYRELIF